MKDKEKTKGNDPVSPINIDTLISERNGSFDNTGSVNPFGLTKREYFAAAVIKGLAANNNNYKPSVMASFATDVADALIRELNRS